MFEWNKVVQDMIDWIEENLDKEPTLLRMSREIGYSPFYCSSQFHLYVKMTLRSYIAGRKLCKAALDLRDTDERIIDIAIKYGFSSQEAFTRSFVHAYGCTPKAYRNEPRAIKLAVKQFVLFPEHLEKGVYEMSNLTEAKFRFEFIPAHKFIGVFDTKATCYWDFWKFHDCDEVCGIVESLSHIAHPRLQTHTAGWYYDKDTKGYFYGLAVEADYQGDIPEGFEVRDVEESYYIVFYHPQFDFLSECGEVMQRVEKLAFNYNPSDKGFEYNDKAQLTYQIHRPEEIGYEILRPVKKIKSE